MAPTPTKLYHITLIDNLPSIIAMGGLRSGNLLKAGGVNCTSIAYQDVQTRRAVRSIACGPQGTIHDYVPFYFAPRSPMLCTIHHGNVPGYSRGEAPILHLVTLAQAVQEAGRGFVFTDGHGIMAVTGFYDDLKDLDKVDWEIMGARYWNDTPQDGDRKRRRQAEFLIHQECPWELIKGIAVMNQKVKQEVDQILQMAGHKPVVKVKTEWYY